MKRNFIAAACCMALLAGCQQAEEIVNPSEELVMFIEASIGKPNTSSRYSGNTPNKAMFTNEDNIGLSVNKKEFVKWTYDGSIWSQQSENAYNWENKTEEHTFYAFYPYTDDATSTLNVTMPSLLGQTGEMSSVASRDFLFASKTQSYGLDGKVSFTEDNAFSHVSSLIAITLKGDADLANATITKISIEGTNLFTPSTYSFEANDVSLSTDTGKEINLLETTMGHEMSSTDKTFYFIVNSNTVELTNVKLAIEYQFSNNDQYKAEHTGLNKTESNSEYFARGKQYNYTLNIQDRALIISGNAIKDWETEDSLGDITINGTKQENNNETN